MQETLEDFALKSLDQGSLTGLSIAVHAIPDAFLLLHVGVGCKHKATSQLSTHDWGRDVVSREAWTEVGDQELITGASERLGPYIRSWARRVKPAWMAVASVTFIDLTGDDIPDVVRKAEETVDCDVSYVKVPGFSGDLFYGYASAIASVVERVDWKRPVERPNEVALLGYMFDRYEGDHEGNLVQLSQMLKGIGLELGSTLFSGEPYAQLRDAGRAGLVAQMPYAAPRKKAIATALAGRRSVEVDLPIGIANTSRWLRSIGAAASVPEAKIERYVRAREEQMRTHLARWIPHWRSMRVAVVAEPPLAAGVCAMLVELGLSPRLVGLKAASLGGKAEFLASCARAGVVLPDDLEIHEQPSLALLRERFTALLVDRRLDGVLGSATDLNVLRTVPPETFMSRHAGGAIHPQGPFQLEIGFPKKDFHASYPMPFVGYAGAMMWAQRILDAPRLWDAGRRAGFGS